MIVFNLICDDCEYQFEGWFDNAADFKSQKDVNLSIVQIVKEIILKKHLSHQMLQKRVILKL